MGRAAGHRRGFAAQSLDGHLSYRDDGALAGVLRPAGGCLRRAERAVRAAVHAWRGAGRQRPPGQFLDLFFFSVETISTTGYGDMYPQTLYGHVVATIEDFVGLVATAAMTGLVFARFARPRARLIFARNPVIFEHDGVATLAVRVVNARNSFISEATAKIWMLGPSLSRGGAALRRLPAVAIAEGRKPGVALSWTLFHPIDEASPLVWRGRNRYVEERSTSWSASPAWTRCLRRSSTPGSPMQLKTCVGITNSSTCFVVTRTGRSHVDLAKVHDTQPVKPKVKDA